jgi:hypothetical protein
MSAFAAALVVAGTLAEIPSMHGNNEMHKYRKALPAPMNADVPYLKCPVCRELAAEAYSQVLELVAAAPKPKAKKRRFETSSALGNLEEQTEDLLSKMCDPDNDGAKKYGQPQKSAAGKWISFLDVQKKDRALVLAKMKEGHCRRECRTIEKVCEDVVAQLTDDDDTDAAAYLVKAAKEGLPVGTVTQVLCTKVAGVCKKGKTALWPEGKSRMNEQFKAKTDEDLRQEEVMATSAGDAGTGITIIDPTQYDVPDENGRVKPRATDPIDVLKEEL